MSGGKRASKAQRSPLAGWSKASRAAWSAGRSSEASASRAAAARRGRARAAVGRVARDRVADRGQVHADLVGAAGVDAHAQQRGAVEALRRPVASCGPRGRAGRGSTSSCGGPGRGRSRRRSRPARAAAPRARAPGTPSRRVRPANWRAERAMGRVVLGDHEQPGGPAVQPVHDARAAARRRCPRGRARGGAARSRACRRRARRRDGPPGRRACRRPAAGVLVDERERDVLGLRLRRLGLRGPRPRPAGRRLSARRGAARAAVERTWPAAISAWRRARLSAGQPLGEPGVEALAGLGRCDDQQVAALARSGGGVPCCAEVRQQKAPRPAAARSR